MHENNDDLTLNDIKTIIYKLRDIYENIDNNSFSFDDLALDDIEIIIYKLRNIYKNIDNNKKYNTVKKKTVSDSTYKRHEKWCNHEPLKCLQQTEPMCYTYLDYQKYYNSNNNNNNNNNNKSNKSNKIIINLSSTKIEAVDLDYVPAFYYPWLHAECCEFKNGHIIFSVVVADSYLDIQMYDETNNRILGSHTTITKSGIYKFPINNPLNNTILSLKIKKASEGVIYPTISGIVLIYEQ